MSSNYLENANNKNLDGLKRRSDPKEEDEPETKRTTRPATKRPTLYELSLGDFNTHAKQRLAVEELQKSRAIWKDDLRIFSYELKGGDGERRYLVTTLQRFWKWYINQKERHIYELIYEDMPCRLYFDLEYSKEINPNVDHQKVYSHFTSTLAKTLSDLYGISTDVDKDLLVLESSTDTKFSAHVICHLENGLLFPSSMSIRHFSDVLSKKLLDDSPEKLLNADGKHITLFDPAVYSRNRNFRILLSSKMGKAARLELAPYCRFYELRGIKKANTGRMFLDSLCVPSQYHKFPVLDKQYFQNNESLVATEMNKRTNLTGKGRPGEGPSPLPHFDDFIKVVLQKWTPNVYIRSWKVVENNGKISSITYYPGNCRYCFNIGREHKSNGIYWTVDIEKGHFFQKCFDPDCRGTSSNYFPLPEFVKSENQQNDADKSILESSRIELQHYFTNWDSVFDL